MNATQKLICILAGGATLVLAAPVFADSGRDRGHDFDRSHGNYSNYNNYSNYSRNSYREHYRGYDRRRLVVVQRPVIVERPVYYAEPAPIAYQVGPAAIIGAVLGGYIDSQRFDNYRR